MINQILNIDQFNAVINNIHGLIERVRHEQKTQLDCSQSVNELKVIFDNLNLKEILEQISIGEQYVQDIKSNPSELTKSLSTLDSMLNECSTMEKQIDQQQKLLDDAEEKLSVLKTSSQNNNSLQ